MSEPKGFFQGSQLRSNQPARTLPQCGACGLFRGCSTPKMTPAGVGARRVLFVGEAPSRDDDEAGAPFKGSSGKYLRRVLRSLHFNLDADGWATNAIICRPHGRGPTPAEVTFCQPNVTKAIKKLNPDVIVPMGQAAVTGVLGPVWKDDIGTMERWAGWRIPCQALNTWVCPTWSPATVERADDPVLTKQFTKHLAAAVGVHGRPWPDGPPNWGNDVHIELDPGAAATWLRRCAAQAEECGAISWDYETNMLKPDGPDAIIATCAVAWGRTEPEKCIAFPWHGEPRRVMESILRSPIPKIASNLKFEDRWSRKEFGRRVYGWAWDTMVAAHVCDNRQATTSVKFQGFVRHGIPVWNDKVEPFLKTHGGETVNSVLREIDINDLLLYKCLDAIIEFRVAIDQMRELGYPIPWRI